MSKFSQLLKMINLLKENERMNRKELAKELGVSERMIRKYVGDLLEANINILSFPGAKGGYELHGNTLTETEKEAYENTIKELKLEINKLQNKIDTIENFLK